MSRAGRSDMDVSVRPMIEADASACAAIACASAVGARYTLEPATLSASLMAAIGKGDMVLVAEHGGRVAGFAWIDPHGAFSTAPYLRLIAVDGSLRGKGVGSALLAEFEARTAAVGRDYCLLVSDWNEGARAFYEKHGYRKAGALPDFARPGITELLMVKSRRKP
jgi:ribosomal protein S18 acetylase RimI-like enzyme